MNDQLTIGLLFFLCFSLISPAQTPPASPPVLLVSIDGMRADYLTEADRYGLKLKALRRLAAQGTVARRMIPVYPSVTYPAHTSIITGCRPAAHGILSNERFEPLVDSRGDWYWFDRDIRPATLHGVFKRARRTTASVSWPATVGAKSIDWLVPEYWDPADFDASFLAKSEAASTPGIIEAARKRFRFEPDLHRLDECRMLIARHIVLAHKPALLLVHLADLDKKQHQHGPATTEAFAALEQSDRFVGDLLDTYREAGMAGQLVTCVVSDHGFEAVDKEFRPNAVLRQAGLIDYDPVRGVIRGWRAKAWVHGGCAAVMIADSRDDAVVKRVREAFAPFTGAPAAPVERIIEPAELARAGASHIAAFMLEPAPGVTFASSVLGQALRPSTVKGMHGQHPDRPEMAAVFIIAGPGVPHGRIIDQVRMIDVAPTIAKLAGVELPGAEGQAIAQLIEPVSRPATPTAPNP